MKSFINLLLGGFMLLTVASCSKDDDSIKPDSSPKEYNIEYRISSTTASEAETISFTNETGGDTRFSNVKLPATYKFKKTMKFADILTLLASVDGGTANSDITAAILLDGKEKAKETGRGVDATAVSLYQIGQ